MPSYIRYGYLGNDSILREIISSSLKDMEDEELLRVLRDHKAMLRQTIADIKELDNFERESS